MPESFSPSRRGVMSKELSDYKADNVRLMDEADRLKKIVGPAADVKSPIGKRSLKECEAIIESGIHAHVDAWLALKEIHDRKLYRPGFEDFKSYCLDRWGYSREGYRYLQAANVTTVVTPELPAPPTSAHAAQLAPLLKEPAKLREAWSLALELEHPTFLEVKDIVAGFLPKDARAEPVKPGEDKVYNGGLAGQPEPGTIGDSRSPAGIPVSPHLSTHLSLDQVLEDCFAKADSGDNQMIEDLQWAQWSIQRKLISLGFTPYDPKNEEPT